MEIPKEKIIELLRRKGADDEADRAETNLPDTVDHEQHGDLLKDHGVDPGELVADVKGRFGL